MIFDPVFPILKVNAGDCRNCGRPLDPATSWACVAPDGTTLWMCSFVCVEDQDAAFGREP